MAGKIDTFLKLSIIASVVVVSASVAQYYLVYLPQRDSQFDAERRMERARADAEKQAEQAKAEAERQRAQRELEERQAAERAAAQARYQACMDLAESNFLSSWAAECKRFADIPGRDKSPTCTLPRVVGEHIEDNLEKARNRCLQENRTGLQ